MKAVSINDAKEQLGQLVSEACRGEVIVLTDGENKVTLMPGHGLDLYEDSEELELELLQALDGPSKPYYPAELREIADKALRDHSAGKSK